MGVAGKVLLGAALTTVGMGLTTATSSADPVSGSDTTQSTSDSRPASPRDVRSMTDRELGDELGQVSGKDSLREQEIVTEMKQRGHQFWEAPPATRGVGVSGGVPVRPGASVTGTLAYDPAKGSWVTSGGVRVGKPGAPQFTGVAPKPDGLNAEGNANVRLGPHAEFSSKFTFNVAPDLSVSGSYRAKGTVTTPDGRSYETEVVVERRADGTWHTQLPDGVTMGTPLPGGGSIDTKQPADPTEEAQQPELKGSAPETKKSDSWFDFGAGVSIDKEFLPAPLPPPTAEEFERAKESFAREQAAQRERTENWKAQNRPEAERREGLEAAADAAAAAEAARRAALPDRDHDGRPDEEDQTWNQNDTDPASSDIGDGPEGGEGYGSDRVENPPVSSPPSEEGDFDGDGLPNQQDQTWNQNDTDPTSSDLGDGPESGADYSGSGVDSTPNQGEPSQNDTDPTSSDPGDGPEGDAGYGESDMDGDGLTGAADATPNQNDTDPTSSDLGDGPESGADYSGSGVDSTPNQGESDADGDGLTGAADATPNQNDTDPTSSDIGDGPEGGEGYGGSSQGGDSGSGSDAGTSGGTADSGAGTDTSGGTDSGTGTDTSDTSGSGGYSGGTDSSTDSGAGTDGAGTGGTDSGGTDSSAGTDGADTSGTDSGGTDSGSTDSADADGDGLSGAADSTPNQNDTDPASTDVGDGPEGNAGYGGATDSGGYGADPGNGDCACV